VLGTETLSFTLTPDVTSQNASYPRNTLLFFQPISPVANGNPDTLDVDNDGDVNEKISSYNN
jgi:hypothetical protein